MVVLVQVQVALVALQQHLRDARARAKIAVNLEGRGLVENGRVGAAGCRRCRRGGLRRRLRRTRDANDEESQTARSVHAGHCNQRG